MENNLPKGEKNSQSKILSLVSAVFFLIGSIYYSYIHIKTAYARMHTITHTKLPDGMTEFGWEFRMSNINLPSVLSCLLVLVLAALTVLLFVLAIKDKLHILTAAISAVIISLQLIIERYTQLEEYSFAKYVLRLGEFSYYLGFLVKYVPFAIALALSVMCFADVIHSQKRVSSEC